MSSIRAGPGAVGDDDPATHEFMTTRLDQIADQAVLLSAGLPHYLDSLDEPGRSDATAALDRVLELLEQLTDAVAEAIRAYRQPI